MGLARKSARRREEVLLLLQQSQIVQEGRKGFGGCREVLSSGGNATASNGVPQEDASKEGGQAAARGIQTPLSPAKEGGTHTRARRVPPAATAATL